MFSLRVWIRANPASALVVVVALLLGAFAVVSSGVQYKIEQNFPGFDQLVWPLRLALLTVVPLLLAAMVAAILSATVWLFVTAFLGFVPARESTSQVAQPVLLGVLQAHPAGLFRPPRTAIN